MKCPQIITTTPKNVHDYKYTPTYICTHNMGLFHIAKPSLSNMLLKDRYIKHSSIKCHIGLRNFEIINCAS